MANGRQRFERSLSVALAGLVWSEAGEYELEQYILYGQMDARPKKMPYDARAMEELAKSGKWSYG